jgi:hypothetical protein
VLSGITLTLTLLFIRWCGHLLLYGEGLPMNLKSIILDGSATRTQVKLALNHVSLAATTLELIKSLIYHVEFTIRGYHK